MEKVARRPFFTFFEAEGVALVEQHGVEQQSAVLAERDRGTALVAILLQKLSYPARILVELPEIPPIWVATKAEHVRVETVILEEIVKRGASTPA